MPMIAGRFLLLCLALAGAFSSSRGAEGVVLWGSTRFDIREFNRPLVAVAAGGRYTMALKSDGTVVAWDSAPEVPASLSNVRCLAAGFAHALAVTSNGTVVAWGYNLEGQTNVPVGLGNARQVAGGYSHSLALRSDGTVIAWGDNTYGQTNLPSGLSAVRALAAGGDHSVAVRSNGTVKAWGRNDFGQINVPAVVSNAIAVAAGDYHTVALNSDGTVLAWGRNNYGQTSVPPGLGGVVAIAAGREHTVALKTNGTIVAWGDGSYGQTSLPADLTDVVAIAAGDLHTVALKSNGNVVVRGWFDYGSTPVPDGLYNLCRIAMGCFEESYFAVAAKTDGTVVAWGNNQVGQCDVPAGLSGVADVAAGWLHTVALRSNGTVVAWGLNDYGQTNVPLGLTGVTQIAAGPEHTVALKSNGEVVAWGYNVYGQTNVPPALSGVRAVAAGNYCSLALQSNGTLVAWGRTSQTNIPGGLSDVSAISAGYDHVVALKSNGTLVAWGGNESGQTNIPAGIGPVAAISAGYFYTVALTSNGTIVAWGLRSDVPAGLGQVKAIAAGSVDTAVLTRLPGPPIVDPWPTTNQTAISALLRGTVTANGADATTVFQWGTNAADLPFSLPATPGTITGTAPVEVSASLSLLRPLTTYFWQLRAENECGAVTGAVCSFITRGCDAGSPPLATTTAASGVTESAARLGGQINPSGSETWVWFECGTNLGYGTATASQNLGTGTNTVSPTHTIHELTPATTYHFRAVAQNCAGISYGADCMFSTLLTPGGQLRVNTSTEGAHRDPAIAMDWNGNYIVVWTRVDPSFGGIWAQRYDADGSPVGSNFRISTVVSNQHHPAVAMRGTGEFIVTWESDSDVLACRFGASGSRVGTEFQVNTYMNLWQSSPAVAMDGAGNFVVAWSGEGLGDSSGIFARRFDSTGTAQGDEFKVNSETAGDIWGHSVARNWAGEFVVAWHRVSPEGEPWPVSLGVYAQRYNAAGEPQGGEFRVDANFPAVWREWVPATTVDASGNFLVAWETAQSGLRAQRFDSTGQASGESLRVDTSGNATFPHAAVDGAGDLLLVWNKWPWAGVHGQKIRADGLLMGSEVRVEEETEFFGGQNPQVAVNRNGSRAAVTWDLGSAGTRIYTRSFRFSPRPILLSLTLTNGQPMLSWNSIAGSRYRVLGQASLGEAAWQDLGNEFLATGISASIFLSPPVTSNSCFYRVSQTAYP